MTVSPSLPAARPTGPAPTAEDPATVAKGTAETFARAMSEVAGDRPADQPAERPADQPASDPATGPERPAKARATRRSQPGDSDQPAGPGDGSGLVLPVVPAVPGPAAAPTSGSTGGPAERPGPGDGDAVRVATEPLAAQPAAASVGSGSNAGAEMAAAAGKGGPAPAFPDAPAGPASSGAWTADPAVIGAGRSLTGGSGPTSTPDAKPDLPSTDAATLAAAIRLGTGDDAVQVTVAALSIAPGVQIAAAGTKPSPLTPGPFTPPSLAPAWPTPAAPALSSAPAVPAVPAAGMPAPALPIPAPPEVSTADTAQQPASGPILPGPSAAPSGITGAAGATPSASSVPSGTALAGASSPGSGAGLPTASPAPAQPGSGGPISPTQLAVAHGPPAATVGTGPEAQPAAGRQVASGPDAAAPAVAGPTGPAAAGVADPTARSSASAAAQVRGGSGTSRRPEAVPGDGARPGDPDPDPATEADATAPAALPPATPAAMPGAPAPQRVPDIIQPSFSSSAAGATPATPAAIAAQVARQVTGLRTLTTGTQHTVLHLNPDHLGALTLTIDVRGGQVTLGIAGDPGTLSTLGQGLDRLRDQLAQSGLGLGDVTMRPDPSSANARAAPDGQPSSQSTADPGRGGRGDTPRDPAPRDPAPGNQAPGLGFGPGHAPGSRGGSGRLAPQAPPVPVGTGDDATDRFDLRV